MATLVGNVLMLGGTFYDTHFYFFTPNPKNFNSFIQSFSVTASITQTHTHKHEKRYEVVTLTLYITIVLRDSSHTDEDHIPTES